VEDSGGNVITTSQTINLGITSGTGTAGATLTCANNSVTTSTGVATFTGCAVDKVSTGYTLSATDVADNLTVPLARATEN